MILDFNIMDERKRILNRQLYEISDLKKKQKLELSNILYYLEETENENMWVSFTINFDMFFNKNNTATIYGSDFLKYIKMQLEETIKKLDEQENELFNLLTSNEETTTNLPS